jgi:hypothetical protein
LNDWHPAGFESTIPWFVGGDEQSSTVLKQELATLASPEINVVQSQSRHTKRKEPNDDGHWTVEREFGTIQETSNILECDTLQ